MMYRYNDNGRLVTSWAPLHQFGDAINFNSEEEARLCVGFDADGKPIIDNTILEKEKELARQRAADTIKNAFEIDASTIGVEFNGVFYTIEDGVAVFNPRFQYDFLSIQKLESVVSDARVPYWRTVDNKNLALTLQNKMDLLELLKVTYFSKFKESRDAIDAL